MICRFRTENSEFLILELGYVKRIYWILPCVYTFIERDGDANGWAKLDRWYIKMTPDGPVLRLFGPDSVCGVTTSPIVDYWYR